MTTWVMLITHQSFIRKYYFIVTHVFTILRYHFHLVSFLFELVGVRFLRVIFHVLRICLIFVIVKLVWLRRFFQI